MRSCLAEQSDPDIPVRTALGVENWEDPQIGKAHVTLSLKFGLSGSSLKEKPEGHSQAVEKLSATIRKRVGALTISCRRGRCRLVHSRYSSPRDTSRDSQAFPNIQLPLPGETALRILVAG